MEALKLTRSTLKSNAALQTVSQSKRGRVIIGLASSANKSWRGRINLDRWQMVVALLEYDGRLSTSGARYPQQKQVDLFIRPLTQFGADQDIPNNKDKHDEDEDEEMVVAKLRLVAAAAADRAEMHGVMAEQRDGWNKLLLSSLTNFTLAALILQALPNNSGNSIAASLLYGFSAPLMCGVNKILGSQGTLNLCYIF